MYFINDPYLSRDPLRMTRNRLLTRTGAPASEPLTLAEAKLYLRVDNSNEDTLVSDLIVAARMHAEGWLWRSLINQSWQLRFDQGVPETVWLPMGPVNSITSITIVNRDTTTQTVDSGIYYLNAAQNALELDSVLLGFRIQIGYTAGYGSDGSYVPKPIKQGMLAHIAAMYDNRGESETAELPDQVAGLYTPFREVRL